MLQIPDSDLLIDGNCLRTARYDSKHLFSNPRISLWQIIYSTECYNPQYQKPSKGQ